MPIKQCNLYLSEIHFTVTLPPREQYMDQIVNLVMFTMDRTVAQSYRRCIVQVVTKRVVSDIIQD